MRFEGIEIGRRKNVSLRWAYGDETDEPDAGATLLRKKVTAGKAGYIYGYFLSANETNDFRISWENGGDAQSVRVPLVTRGELRVVESIAINEGIPADAGSELQIKNVKAGSSGSVYQVGILYAEV